MVDIKVKEQEKISKEELAQIEKTLKDLAEKLNLDVVGVYNSQIIRLTIKKKKGGQ